MQDMEIKAGIFPGKVIIVDNGKVSSQLIGRGGETPPTLLD